MSKENEVLPDFPYPDGVVVDTTYPDHNGTFHSQTYLLFDTELFTKQKMLDFAREYARLNK